MTLLHASPSQTERYRNWLKSLAKNTRGRMRDYLERCIANVEDNFYA